MKRREKPLSETNPYFRDPKLRDKMILVAAALPNVRSRGVPEVGDPITHVGLVALERVACLWVVVDQERNRVRTSPGNARSGESLRQAANACKEVYNGQRPLVSYALVLAASNFSFSSETPNASSNRNDSRSCAAASWTLPMMSSMSESTISAVSVGSFFAFW